MIIINRYRQVGGMKELKLYEVVELESFKNVQVITGEKGLNNRVDNVYVMEVPDITSYIDKDGLLLTTLFPIIKSQEALEKFIPELIQSGLAGVAIKLGRYIESIPSFMIEQAEKSDFPILLLPSTANFSILTNDVLMNLLGMKTKELEFRESISNKLHTLMLSGADISDLVTYVSQLTNMDIIVLSSQLKYIESSLLKEPETFQVEEEILYCYESDSSKEGLPDIFLRIDDRAYSQNDLIIHSIDAGQKRMGYLVLIKKGSENTSSLLVVIEQAVILLVFLLQNRQSLIQTERNYLDNFIRSIIHSQFNSQLELIQKAKVFKWDIHFPNIILLIDITNETQKEKLSNYYKVLDSGIIIETIARICGIPIEQCKTAIYDNQIICFVSVALVTDLSAKLKRASEVFAGYLKRFGQVNISISNKVFSMEEISRAFEEAALVQNIYKDIYQASSFIKFYEDLGLFKLFHSIRDKRELSHYVTEKLGVIVESDQTNDMELIKTLGCLIKNNMNMKKSAEELFIHYNSLRYRVNKLRDLGIKITDGNELTEIAVALQALEYLHAFK